MIEFPPTITHIVLPSQGIYRPEAYGTVTNTDADKALVQAALDAASIAGSGSTVRLDQTYGYTDGVVHDGVTEDKIGPYTSTVGFWLNSSGITIDGNGTGVLRITALPTFTASYIAFLVGNGGFNGSGALPPGWDWDWIDTNGTWTENVTIKNLTFDNSVLTDANLATLTASTIGAVLLFAFCKGCLIEGITVDRGYGSTGTISTHCSSKNNTLKDCTVTLTTKWGYWLDGCENSIMDNLDALGFLDAAGNAGLVCATNVDYLHGSSLNTVTNCTFTGCLLGIGGTGENSTIDNCAITLAGVGTKIGINLDTRNAINGCWWHHDVEVSGCTIARGGGVVGTIFGVQLTGVNAALVDGLPRESSQNNIHNNVFSASPTAYALVLNVQASYNTFRYNTITATVSTDISGGTAHDNTIGPNP